MGVPYVSNKAVELAASWARRFQQLLPAVGVLFISVKPIPVEQGECTTFEVRLGVREDFDESTGLSLIKHVLSEEIASGKYEIQGAAYRGVSGAGRPPARSATGPYPS